MKTDLGAFSFGAICYPLLEIACRGRTHGTMSIAGGISMALLHKINRKHGKENLAVRCLRGAILITAVEGIFGAFFNRRKKIWNYSHLPLNINGQVCLPYFCIWYFLCLIVLPFDAKT